MPQLPVQWNVPLFRAASRARDGAIASSRMTRPLSAWAFYFRPADGGRQHPRHAGRSRRRRDSRSNRAPYLIPSASSAARQPTTAGGTAAPQVSASPTGNKRGLALNLKDAEAAGDPPPHCTVPQRLRFSIVTVREFPPARASDRASAWATNVMSSPPVSAPEAPEAANTGGDDVLSLAEPMRPPEDSEPRIIGRS